MEGMLGRVSDWLIEIDDQGQRWAMPNWESVRVSLALNKAATMKIKAIGGTGVDEWLQERRTDVTLLRDGLPYFRGRLTDMKDKLTDKSHLVDLEIIDYAGILQHRFLQPPDLLDTIVDENQERASAWEVTTQYRPGTIVIDPMEAFPNQQFMLDEARDDPWPLQRKSDWAYSRAYEAGDVCIFEGRSWITDRDQVRVSVWSENSTYLRGEVTEYDGNLWRSTTPDDMTGDPDPTGTVQPKGQNRNNIPGDTTTPATWTSKVGYWRNSIVVRNGRRYQTSRDIPPRGSAPGTEDGESEGWEPYIKGGWTKISSNTFNPGVAAGWSDNSPSRPGLNVPPGIWLQVPNDRYKARRYVIANDPVPPAAPETMVPPERVGLAQEDMAWDLLTMTQSKLSGDLQITRGSTENLGRKRDRTFTFVSQTVFELIDDCGRANDGFEWWIDAERRWQTQSPVRWRDRRGTLTLDYGSTVMAVDRESSGAYFTSTVYEGSDDFTTAETFEVAADARGRWETYNSDNDIVKQSTLRERADEVVTRAAQDYPFYKMDLTPGVFHGADVRLGDVFPIRIVSPPRLNVMGLGRVIEIDLEIRPDGDERVTIGLESVSDELDMNTVGARFSRSNRIDKWHELGDLLAGFDKNLRQLH